MLDDGALHALGNGRIICYGSGAEWEQVFGTPYTSPTALSLRRADAGARVSAERLSGGWRHTAPEGIYEDAVAAEIACLARAWRLERPAQWRIGGHGFRLLRNAEWFPGCADAFLLTIPGGSAAYNWYPTHAVQYIQMVFAGGCAAQIAGDSVAFTASGEGALFVASGSDLPGCVAAARAGVRMGFQAIARECETAARALLSERRLNARAIDESHPLGAAVDCAADEVALLIRAQQGADGGVLAGSNYHLAYVRDQYGVSRGLLAMGCFEPAKDILRFYRKVFRTSGTIRNAQGIGVPDLFHVHENDDVEITGYLVHQICDILDATGDRELFDSLAPIAEWALRAQGKWLHRGMLPFNGDETYVAGGILPRTVLPDGSMEATMLFVTCAERYRARLGGSIPAWLSRALESAEGARGAYARNFRRGNEWVANSRARLDGLAFPEFRHGVCLSGASENCARFGWLMRADDGGYVCPACFGKKELPPAPPTEYRLRPALLMHAYMDSNLVPRAELRAGAEEALADFRATGAVSSLPEGGKSLGYDYGLMLFAARKFGLRADDLLLQMLRIRDSAGAWVEYYEENRPLGTRCRPWESAINIEAALACVART